MCWAMRAVLCGVLATILGGCATTVKGHIAREAGIATGFINKTMSVNGTDRAYVVYVPREYDPRKPWPLIVFLHGAGERGDDGLKQTEVGIGRAVRFNSERFPCIIVMPQCPDGGWWDAAVDDIEQAYRDTVDSYNIDPKRVYLTGLSMGGFGTWIYGAQHVDRFAALLPICGGGRLEDVPALSRVPIWAFHGADDETVFPDESIKMVNAVKAANGNVTYTEYEDTGHNSWDKAYGDGRVIRWLLRQSK